MKRSGFSIQNSALSCSPEAFGGCGRGSGFGGRLAMVDCDVQIGIADFVVAGFHLREFFFADHGAGCGIENGFLLVHEVATVVD